MLFTMFEVPNNTEQDPIVVLKDKWKELDTYTIHIGCIHCSGWYSFIAQKYFDHTYGSAIIFSYNYNKPKYLTLINNAWTEIEL